MMPICHIDDTFSFQMINPVAETLKIPYHRIYANNLLFKEDGQFSHFDEKVNTGMSSCLNDVSYHLRIPYASIDLSYYVLHDIYHYEC